MKWLKRILFLLLIVLIAGGIFLGRFIYKAKIGFENYDTEPHGIEIPSDQPAILVISKTNGFRHGEAIEASRPMLDQLAKSENWFLYETEDTGIINAKELNQFDVVVWNNSTGPVLNEAQQKLLESFVQNGGGFVGIHAAGDASKRWPWYHEHLIRADFSHHPIKNQFQKTTVTKSNIADSSWINLPISFDQTDEWYVFFDQPRNTNILYTIDGTEIDPNGNLLMIKDKDFGMGEVHPVAWYHTEGAGKVFYTSMGHTGETFSHPAVVELIRAAIEWSMRSEFIKIKM